jgi:hypothetical protein
MTIWYNMWTFIVVCCHLVYFSRFGMFCPRKIWQPCCRCRRRQFPEKGKFTDVGYICMPKHRYEDNKKQIFSWGWFFVHFFPRKITFRGNFCGISWKNNFSKLFPQIILLFPNIFWGKIFRWIFPEIFPGKNVRKIGPRILKCILEYKTLCFGMLV